MRPDAARALLDWLQVEGAGRGVVDEASWDDPDMFIIHIRLNVRFTAIAWMIASRIEGGCEVSGRLVVSDAFDSGPGFTINHMARRKQTGDDYREAAQVMQAGFTRLFAGLDQALPSLTIRDALRAYPSFAAPRHYRVGGVSRSTDQVRQTPWPGRS